MIVPPTEKLISDLRCSEKHCDNIFEVSLVFLALCHQSKYPCFQATDCKMVNVYFFKLKKTINTNLLPRRHYILPFCNELGVIIAKHRSQIGNSTVLENIRKRHIIAMLTEVCDKLYQLLCL